MKREESLERARQAREMHERGATWDEVGAFFGVSRQRANQMANYEPGTRVHKEVLKKLPFKGLREWMLENNVSIKELQRRTGAYVLRNGNGITKRSIDAILLATGLTYEECFYESAR